MNKMHFAWEFLKYEIRKFSIKFSKEIALSTKSQSKILEIQNFGV